MADRKTLLALGFGYSAQATAIRLVQRGWRVIGTTRSEERAKEIEALGVEAVIWPPNAALIGEATHLLVSASPDADGDPSLLTFGDAIKVHAKRLEWAGYLSTIGVYGDREGEWVDETTTLKPTSKRAIYRVAAENAWRETGAPLHIFRIAGIYGPGRGPFEKIRSGKARRIIKEGQVFNRIHRDDIATSILCSIDRPKPGSVYNLCDDLPAPPQQVTEYAAKLLGLPPPPAEPFETADLSPMARSFYGDSRRVSNRKLRYELGVALAYPTYREGLKAILDEEGAHIS